MSALAAAGSYPDSSWYLDVTDFARHTGWLNTPADVFTTVNVLALVALVALAWWRARRGPGQAMAAVICAPVAVALAVAVNYGIKAVVAETRPCRVVPHAYTISACPPPGDYSFPSNHTALAAALATAVFLINRRLGVLAGALALLEGLSRVYIGAHYPHDVAAGLLVGAVVTLAAARLLRGPAGRVLDWLARTRLRPLVHACAGYDTR